MESDKPTTRLITDIEFLTEPFDVWKKTLQKQFTELKLTPDDIKISYDELKEAVSILQKKVAEAAILASGRIEGIILKNRATMEQEDDGMWMVEQPKRKDRLEDNGKTKYPIRRQVDTNIPLYKDIHSPPTAAPNQRQIGYWTVTGLSGTRIASHPSIKAPSAERAKAPNGKYYDDRSWGKLYERFGIEEYKRQTGLKVTYGAENIGIFIEPDGKLSGRPDAFVKTGPNSLYGLIEVKCPYSYSATSEGLETYPHLQKIAGIIPNIKTEFTMRKGTSHYVQVQSYLYLTGLSWAHYVLWTPTKTIIAYVGRDDKMISDIIRYIREYNMPDPKKKSILESVYS